MEHLKIEFNKKNLQINTKFNAKVYQCFSKLIPAFAIQKKDFKCPELNFTKTIGLMLEATSSVAGRMPKTKRFLRTHSLGSAKSKSWRFKTSPSSISSCHREILTGLEMEQLDAENTARTIRN